MSTQLIRVPVVQVSKTVPIVTHPGSGNSKNKNKRKRRNRKRNRNRNRAQASFNPSSRNQLSQSSGRGGVTNDYIRSLLDPFEYRGCRLGWGTMVPTQLASAYLRTTVTANADGSLGLLAYPNAVNMLSVFAGGAAVAAATSSVNATDAAAIAANFDTGRPISIGIRAIPSIALTSAPGFCYAGALPGMTNTSANALTVNDLVAFPTSILAGNAVTSGSSTGRPQDLNSFTFLAQAVNASGFAGTTPLPFSVPYLAYTGMPAGATVSVEVVFNFEGIELLAHSAAGLGTGEVAETSLLSNAWNSIESMWSSVKQVLPPPGRAMEAIAALDARFPNVKGRVASNMLGRMTQNYSQQRLLL